MNILSNWFHRTFSNPQTFFLALVLILAFAVILLLGKILMPVLASLVIAYLLEGLVGQMTSRGMPRLVAVLIVFILFLLFLALVAVGIMPLLSQQLTELVQQLPNMISEGTRVLLTLPERYPEFISNVQVQEIIASIRAETISFGQRVLSWSLANVPGIITVLVYVILIPILVFFFMKDKNKIIGWLGQYLPREHGIAGEVWREVDRQISNYVRGKAWEILILWGASYALFYFFGLKYALLLSLLVGLSVIIPFVGATIVTIPLLLVAWFQWGWSSEFVWLAVAYTILQAIDGNVLVPLIFSEVVNLHPIAIIVAILVFGGLWGFWGVFFAIPLATLVQAVMSAWPANRVECECRPVAD